MSYAAALQSVVLQGTTAAPIHVPLTRAELAGLLAACGFTVGAEIGVWTGLNAEVLCPANPHLHLYAVDPWVQQPDYREDKNDSVRMEAAYQEAQQRLATYRVTFLRMPSLDAATRVPDGSLDFVYIDGNHRYEPALADIRAWAPKVRPGGVVSGHDFFTKTKKHIDVERAVRDYTRDHAIAPWFVLQPGKGDKTPSWMWVKQ